MHRFHKDVPCPSISSHLEAADAPNLFGNSNRCFWRSMKSDPWAGEDSAVGKCASKSTAKAATKC